MNPFDYTLCCHTVTLYRLRDGGVVRNVLENCYFAPETGQKTGLTGKSRLRKFLLIIPWDEDVAPGDRLYDGVGPENIQWAAYLPDIQERVYEIGSVKHCHWDGELCHIQAKEAQ